SRKTRSGASVRIISTASRPEAAVRASTSSSCARRSRRRRRASGSSSTTSTRSGWASGIGGGAEVVGDVERERDRSAGAATGRGSEGERGGGSVERVEAGARVAEADALRRALGGLVRQAGAVVLHVEHEAGARSARADGEAAGAVLDAADAVLDGVLDERLEDQVRHERVERAGLDLLGHVERALEADALDVQVVAEEVELVAERDLGGGGLVEGAAQERAQAGDDAADAGGIALDEGADGVERVEEEV